MECLAPDANAASDDAMATDSAPLKVLPVVVGRFAHTPRIMENPGERKSRGGGGHFQAETRPREYFFWPLRHVDTLFHSRAAKALSKSD